MDSRCSLVTVLALAALVCAGGLLARQLPDVPQAPATAPACCPAERLNLPGLPNFFRVAPGLYRGAQPQQAGVAELVKLGVKTVVNLRSGAADDELFAGSGIRVEQIAMNAFFPSRSGFERFLAIAADPARQPVFVHCRHGSDRTGTAVAIYRVLQQRWPVAQAIGEMVDGGFGFHPIHSHLKGFVRRFVARHPAALALPAAAY
jgi:protein tyrosine phosphatase (PTP) superfamily phosphohydrolase (DUF442 family)